MASWLIAFLFGIGGATWVYAKLMRTSGGNLTSALGVSVLAFIFLFVILWSLLSMFE